MVNKKNTTRTSIKDIELRQFENKFYCLYSPLFEIRRQVADDFEKLFTIPWEHHCHIIDKFPGWGLGRYEQLNAR